jgi:hypothetical protein
MARKPPLTIRLIIYAAIITFSVLLAMSSNVEASIAPSIELNSLAIKWRSYLSPGRDALIYPHEHKDAIELSVDMDVLRYFYWDSRVYGITDNSQYRAVGLNAHIGLRFTDSFRAEYEHTSEHLLDDVHSFMPKFPVSDAFVILIDIYKPRRERHSLIGF